VVQAFNASGRDTHKFAHLNAHALIGCDHVRLNNDCHIFGEDESRMTRAACLSGAHQRSKVATAEAM
jgi:hypothetical protein